MVPARPLGCALPWTPDPSWPCGGEVLLPRDPGARPADGGGPGGVRWGTGIAEAPCSVAEWAVALRFDNPQGTVLVLLLSDTPLRVLGFQTP